MPGTHALHQYFHNIFAFDRSQFAVMAGLRKAVLITVLLVVGVLVHQINSGILASLGALVVGFADQGGAYRSRAKVLLLMCVCVSVSALVGGTLGKIAWVEVLLVALWGFTAGLMVAISPAATSIATLSVVILTLATSFTLAPPQVVEAASLILLGGLLQTVASLVLWPLHRYGPERAALSALYDKLAINASRLPNAAAANQASDALADAGITISASVPRYGSGAAAEVFQGLLTKAWSIYLELATLVEAREGLAVQQAEALQRLDNVQTQAATMLRTIANGLAAGKVPVGLDTSLQQLGQTLEALRQHQPNADADPAERTASAAALRGAEALCGTLRATARIATSWAKTGKSDLAAAEPHPPPALQPQNVSDILRANFTLRSAVFRHAIRLSATLACAVVLYMIFPLDRGYWTVLTVVVVLRPDFSTTISRGLARGAGTLLGGVCGGLLLVLLRPDPLMLAFIMGVLVWGTMSTFLANYTIFAFFLTAFVAALVSLEGAPPLPTVEGRVVDTLIGIALATASVLLWPTWARVEVRRTLITLLDADCAYFTAVMENYLHPDAVVSPSLRERRLLARLARSNAEAAIQHSLSDPARFHTNARVALGLLESGQHFMRSVFTIEALRHDARPCQKPPELAAFSADVQRALRLLAKMIEDGAAGAPLPPLRQDQEALTQRLEAMNRQQKEPAHCAFLVVETDHIVDSITSVSNLLATEHA
jgi:uncharacterized membrane protein YccC